MEHADIYDDLDNFGTGISLENFEHENSALTNRVEEQEQLIEKMTADIYELQISNKKLQVNISELFKTAKAEITRKERDIADLRRQVDDIIFQRQKKIGKQVISFPDKDDLVKQMNNLKVEMETKNRIITNLYKKLTEQKHKQEVTLKRNLNIDTIDSRNKRQKYNSDYKSKKSSVFNRNYTNKLSYNRKHRSRSRSPDRSYRHPKSRSRSTDRLYRNTDLRLRLKAKKQSRSRSRERSALSKGELKKIYSNARNCDSSDSEKIKFRPRSPIYTNKNIENKLFAHKTNMPRIGPRSPSCEDRIGDSEKRVPNNSNQVKLEEEDLNSGNKYLRIGPRTPSYSDETTEDEKPASQPNSQAEKPTGTVTHNISDNELLKHEPNCNDRFSENNKPVSQSYSPRDLEIVKYDHYQDQNSDNETPTSQSSNSSKQNPKTIKDQSPHRKPKTRTGSLNCTDKINDIKKPFLKRSSVLQDSKNENNLSSIADSLNIQPNIPIHIDVQPELQCSNSPPRDPRIYRNRERDSPNLSNINIVNYKQHSKRLSSKEYFLQEQFSKENVTQEVLEDEVYSPQNEEIYERPNSPLEMELMDEKNKISEKILSLEEDIRKTKQYLHKKSKFKLRTHKTDTNELNLNSSTDTPLLKTVKKHKNDSKKSIRLKRSPTKIKLSKDDKVEANVIQVEDNYKQSETEIKKLTNIEDCHKYGETNKTSNVEHIVKVKYGSDDSKSDKSVKNDIKITKSLKGKDMLKLIETKEDAEMFIHTSKVEANIEDTKMKTIEVDCKISETDKNLSSNANVIKDKSFENEQNNRKLNEISSQTIEKSLNKITDSNKGLKIEHFSENKLLVKVSKISKTNTKSSKKGKNVKNLIETIKDQSTEDTQGKTDDHTMSVPTKKSVKMEKEKKEIINLEDINMVIDQNAQIKNKIDFTEDKIKSIDQVKTTERKASLVNKYTNITIDVEQINDFNKKSLQSEDIKNTNASPKLIEVKLDQIGNAKNITIEDKLEKTELFVDKKVEKKITKRKRLVTLNKSPRKCKEIKSSEKEFKSIDIDKDQPIINDDKADEFGLITKELTKIFEENDTNTKTDIANEEEKQKKTEDIFIVIRSPRKSKQTPIPSSKIQNKLNINEQSVILKQDIRNIVTIKDILGDSDDCEPAQCSVNVAVNENKLENTTAEIEKVTNTVLNIDKITETNCLVPEQALAEKLGPAPNSTSDTNIRKKLTGRRRRAVICIT